jgi:glucosamine 6-phosphate synthetase-like amidotransferase/phosphosugar isomerase protein
VCHINIIKRKDEYCDDNINYYMDIVSWNSFSSNSDGEGYIGFTSRKLLVDRSLSKILYKNLGKFHTLITHQRFATSGFNLSNVHPHESKNFILQHNGVFTGLGDKNVSDTKCYLDKLEEYYSVNNDIIESVKKLSVDIHGSYSIVLLSKKTNRVYYYKNSSTSMYILEDKNYIVMSTSNNNLRIGRLLLNIKSKIKEVKHGILYELTTTGLKFVTRIEPKLKKIKNYSTLNDFHSSKSMTDYDDYWNDKLNKYTDESKYINSKWENLTESDIDSDDLYYINDKGERVKFHDEK